MLNASAVDISEQKADDEIPMDLLDLSPRVTVSFGHFLSVALRERGKSLVEPWNEGMSLKGEVNSLLMCES